MKRCATCKWFNAEKSQCDVLLPPHVEYEVGYVLITKVNGRVESSRTVKDPEHYSCALWSKKEPPIRG